MATGVLRHMKYFKGWHRTTPSVHQHPPDQRQTKIGRNSRRSVWVRVFVVNFANERSDQMSHAIWNRMGSTIGCQTIKIFSTNEKIERVQWHKQQIAIYRLSLKGWDSWRYTFYLLSFHSSTLSHFDDITFCRRRCFFYTSLHRRHLSQCWLFICCHSLYISFMRCYPHMWAQVEWSVSHTRIRTACLGIVVKRMNDDDDDDKASTDIHE